MKLSWITKFALAFGLRKTETFLAAQPDLYADAHHDEIALAETLGSKTMRALLLAVGCDLLKVVDGIRHDTATADDLVQHAAIIFGAAALMFFRHAIAKRPDVVGKLVDAVKTPLLVALMLSATLGFGQTTALPEANATGPSSNTIAAVTSPRISFNGAVAVDFVEMLPGWKSVESFEDFTKAFGTNVCLNAVYSWSSKGGLSSGGAAVAAPLVKVNWQLDPATFWALYGGPALVIGSDRNGAFSALEAAIWTDPLGPLLTFAQKKFPPLAWRPKQVDAFYGYVGLGVETFGADGAGKTTIISAGLGFKF